MLASPVLNCSPDSDRLAVCGLKEVVQDNPINLPRKPLGPTTTPTTLIEQSPFPFPPFPCPNMDTIGHPPAPDGVETCERADTREHYQSMVTPAFTDLYLAPSLRLVPRSSRYFPGNFLSRAARHDEAATADGRTLDALLPDEVLAVVFGYCDDRTRMMIIPSVSKRWLGLCRTLPIAIDLTWAIVGERDRCAITDAGLAGLVLRFPSLQRLSLGSCDGVTDTGLAAVAAGCPNIQRLDLYGCAKVTDDGLKVVAAGCPNLKHLDLGWSTTLTDGGVEAVAAGCPKLQHLALYGCTSVTDGGLATVAAGCPDLRHLNLCGCTNVADGGVAAVAAGCPKLQHLDLGWCTSVTDDGVAAVAAGCPNLQHLDLFGCSKVTDSGI